MEFASDEVASAAAHPNAADAVAARLALDEAFAAQDVDAVGALFAADLVVHTPVNLIASRDDVLSFFRAGRMNYDGAEVIVDYVEARGDLAVIMGGEVIRPGETAANSGRTVHRRFTDVWRHEPDGQWRLTIRQATITAID